MKPVNKKRCLVVSPKVPYPPNDGGKIRIFNFIKQFSDFYDIDLVSFYIDECKEEHVRYLKRYCRDVHLVKYDDSLFSNLRHMIWGVFLRRPLMYSRYFRNDMATLLKRLIRVKDYDLVVFHHLHMGQYYRLFPNSKNVIDTHNNDMVIMHRWSNRQKNPLKNILGRWQVRCIGRYMKNLFNHFDAIIAVSQKEINQFQRIVPSANFIVANNGVDTEYYKPGADEPESDTLIYTGDMSWWPNTDAALFFLDETFPEIKKKTPGARVIFAGRRPPKELVSKSSKNVEVTGFVEDMRPYFNKAKVFIVPLRIGGGTRLKILEAFAMKIPVVSTSVGCEGLTVEDGTHILIRDKPEKFAEAVLKLLSDDDFCKRLKENAYKLVAEKYDWKFIMGDMVKEISFKIK